MIGQSGQPGQKDKEKQQRIATMVGKITPLTSGRLFSRASELRHLKDVMFYRREEMKGNQIVIFLARISAKSWQSDTRLTEQGKL
jgi:hypothetical protein